MDTYDLNKRWQHRYIAAGLLCFGGTLTWALDYYGLAIAGLIFWVAAAAIDPDDQG